MEIVLVHQMMLSASENNQAKKGDKEDQGMREVPF